MKHLRDYFNSASNIQAVRRQVIELYGMRKNGWSLDRELSSEHNDIVAGPFRGLLAYYGENEFHLETHFIVIDRKRVKTNLAKMYGEGNPAQQALDDLKAFAAISDKNPAAIIQTFKAHKFLPLDRFWSPDGQWIYNSKPPVS